MATVDELLAKLEERFILGEVSEETYKDLLAKLRSRAGAGGAATALGGLTVQDSVIKGDISNISAGSIGNFHLNVGTNQKDGRAEIQYEQFVLTLLQSGGEIEKSRDQLDSRRQELGLTLRIAQDLEVAAAAERKRQASRAEPTVIFKCEGRLSSAAFSEGGGFALMEFDDGTASVWDVVAGREMWRRRLGGGRCCISRDGMLLAHVNDAVEVWESTSEGPRLRWRTESVDELGEDFDSSTDFSFGSGIINDISFSADLKWLALAGIDCDVAIFDVKTGRIIQWPSGGGPTASTIHFSNQNLGWAAVRCAHPASSMGAECVRFTPDGLTLLLSNSYCRACHDHLKTVEIEDAVDLGEGVQHANSLLCCAANGRQAVLTDGSSMHIYRMSHVSRPLFRLEGHTGYVRSVDLSPDARYAASAAWERDGTFRIWCLQTGRCVRCENADVKCVSFSADGRSVLTIESDGVIRRWPLDGL